jgi:opine dehydrogenase
VLQIAVCGEGSIAHSVSAVCGWRGFAVRVLAKWPQRWRRHLAGHLPDGSVFTGAISEVTQEPKTAVANADVVFVCVRHAEIAQTLRRIAPHLNARTLVGAVPGFGGFGLIARRAMPLVNTFFGTQRIPFVITRYVPGKTVYVGGVRRQTFVATMPAQRARPVAELIGRILGIQTVPISHFLNVELSPSNSLVNPARLYTLFGPLHRRLPRVEEEFFLDWDMAASRTLLALDRELQDGRRLIPRDTSFVAPILLQYDANDAKTLTDRIRNLRALAGRRVPVRRCGDAITIDPRTDYLREDIDYGMNLMRDLLRLGGARTPVMDEIVEWRQGLLGSPKACLQKARPSAVAAFATIDDLASALD